MNNNDYNKYKYKPNIKTNQMFMIYIVIENISY